MIEELMNYLNFINLGFQILTPLIFMGADIVSGLIQAVINHTVDTQKMRVGLLHKILLILIMFLSFLVDFAFSLRFISQTVCLYLILMETMSIFENLTKAGINLGKLSDILKIKWEGGTKKDEIE